MEIVLGNVAPILAAPGATATVVKAGDTPPPVNVDVLARLDPTVAHTTSIVVPDDAGMERILADVSTVWAHQSADAPGWILVPDEGPEGAVSAALRAHFGLPDIPGPVMLLTNAGRDFLAKQMAGAASATAVAKWIALTANSTAPALGDTTLTGEITTPGGGLLRAAATYAHTASTNSYTLTNTFTANGSDSLPVTIAKVGCFDASAAGNLVFATLLSATATLSASGDNIPVTWTVSY